MEARLAKAKQSLEKTFQREISDSEFMQWFSGGPSGFGVVKLSFARNAMLLVLGLLVAFACFGTPQREAADRRS